MPDEIPILTAPTDFDPPLGVVQTVLAAAPMVKMGMVAIRVSNATGVLVYWISPQEANNLSQALKQAASEVEAKTPKLVVPTLVVPNQVRS